MTNCWRSSCTVWITQLALRANEIRFGARPQLEWLCENKQYYHRKFVITKRKNYGSLLAEVMMRQILQHGPVRRPWRAEQLGGSRLAASQHGVRIDQLAAPRHVTISCCCVCLSILSGRAWCRTASRPRFAFLPLLFDSEQEHVLVVV